MTTHGAAAEDAREIQWHGPAQTSQQRRLTSTLVELSNTKITRGEKVLQDHTTRNRLEFEGLVTVLAVDEASRATKVRVEVEKCLFRVGDDQPQPLLAAGTIAIGQTVDGHTEFRAEDKKPPLPSLAATSLAKLIALADQGADEAGLFGNRRKAKPGEKWQADKQQLVKKFRELDASISQDDVAGSAIFDRVVTIDGQQYIDLRMKLTATTDNPRNPPTSMEPVEAKIAVGASLRLPSDYATDWTAEKLETRMTASYRGKLGSRTAGQIMRYESTQTIDAKAEYLKKKKEKWVLRKN